MRQSGTRRIVKLVATGTLCLAIAGAGGILGLFWYLQTPYFIGDLGETYLSPALVLLTARAPDGSRRPADGIVLALTEAPGECIAGTGTAEALAMLPPDPAAPPGAILDCGGHRPVSADELRTVLGERGFQRDPSALERRAKPCSIDPRCYRIHRETSWIEAYLLYDETRVQTVRVHHGNHTGTEVAFTYAVDEAGSRRGRAVRLTGREFAYERSP